jgi:hypothetical protein
MSRRPLAPDEVEFLERCVESSTPLDPETIPRLLSSLIAAHSERAMLLETLGRVAATVGHDIGAIAEDPSVLVTWARQVVGPELHTEVQLLRAANKDLIAALDAERSGRVR